MPSTTAPAKLPAEQRADRRSAVVAGATLVEEQPLDEQRAEHAAGELGEDVDERVHRVDPPHDGRGERDRGVEVTAADAPSVTISMNRTIPWTRPTTAKSEPVCALAAGGDVEHDHGANREDEKQRADQLGDVGGESSILH